MKIQSSSILLISIITNEVSSFIPSNNLIHQHRTNAKAEKVLFMSAMKPQEEDKVIMKSTPKSIQNTLMTSLLATMLFTMMPTPDVSVSVTIPTINSNNNGITTKQMNLNNNFVVNAKEMASGTGSRVNKDPESLLRYGLPINNKEVCVCSNMYIFELYVCSI